MLGGFSMKKSIDQGNMDFILIIYKKICVYFFCFKLYYLYPEYYSNSYCFQIKSIKYNLNNFSERQISIKNNGQEVLTSAININYETPRRRLTFRKTTVCPTEYWGTMKNLIVHKKITWKNVQNWIIMMVKLTGGQ